MEVAKQDVAFSSLLTRHGLVGNQFQPFLKHDDHQVMAPTHYRRTDTHHRASHLPHRSKNTRNCQVSHASHTLLLKRMSTNRTRYSPVPVHEST